MVENRLAEVFVLILMSVVFLLAAVFIPEVNNRQEYTKEIKEADVILCDTMKGNKEAIYDNEIKEDVVKEHEDKEINQDTAKEVLMDSVRVDEEYKGVEMRLSEYERKLVERVVMGETSGSSMEAAAVVAQAIRDAAITDRIPVSRVISSMSYTSNLREPNDNVINAVKFIFDDGKCAVKHRVMYFYAPKVTRSRWHESQNFVVECGGHRVFDRRSK